VPRGARARSVADSCDGVEGRGRRSRAAQARSDRFVTQSRIEVLLLRAVQRRFATQLQSLVVERIRGIGRFATQLRA
jgi:hypothetical protein